MKSRIFILGFLSCLLMGSLVWCGFRYVKYPQRAYVERVNAGFPGYVLDGDSDAQMMAKESYWDDKQDEVRLAAEQWCKEEGISAEVKVSCYGSLENCFFSVECEGWMSADQRKRLDQFVKHQINLTYHEISLTRDKIYSRWMRVNL